MYVYHIGLVMNGKFGCHMDVMLVNDGPVTILLDSDEDIDRSDSSESKTKAKPSQGTSGSSNSNNKGGNKKVNAKDKAIDKDDSFVDLKYIYPILQL